MPDCSTMKAPSPGAAADAVSKPVEKVTKPARHVFDTRDFPLDKRAWTNPICMDGIPALMFHFGAGTRTKICADWCGTKERYGKDYPDGACISGDEVKQKRDACCADKPPCNRAGLPKC